MERKPLQMVDKSIRHLMTSPFITVFFKEGGGAKKILENYRSYNTSPGFGDTFIVIIIIIIMKFAHHIKKSRQDVI